MVLLLVKIYTLGINLNPEYKIRVQSVFTFSINLYYKYKIILLVYTSLPFKTIKSIKFYFSTEKVKLFYTPTEEKYK